MSNYLKEVEPSIKLPPPFGEYNASLYLSNLSALFDSNAGISDNVHNGIVRLAQSQVDNNIIIGNDRNDHKNSGFEWKLGELKNEKNIKTAGSLVCDGHDGVDLVINPRLSNDQCGIKECVIQHEEMHLMQIKSEGVGDLCLGGQAGQELGYVDNATAIKYERPAYKETVNCLENKKAEIPWYDFICNNKLDDAIDSAKYTFEVKYGEKL